MPIASRSTDTPAEVAAKLLTRLGLAVLFVALPVAGVFWRSALYVLLPVGTVLILIGALSHAPHHAGRGLRDAVGSPVALAALFVALWAALSLIWTPFPAQAGERFFQFFAAALLTLLAAVHLPQRTKTADLYLPPAGLALASAVTLALAYFEPPWLFGAFAFDETLFERAMITAIVLVWPALGLLSLREHWIAASVLAVLVAGVALAGFAQTALLAMGAGALAFALAMSGPEKTARFLAWLVAALIMLAPVFPLLYGATLALFGIQTGAGSEPMLVWRDLVLSQWPRLITGHGVDFVHWGLSAGYLPAGTPRSLLFVIWHDLGIVGAAALTALVVLAFKAAGRAPAEASPALLAGLAAVLAIAVLGLATAQVWWLMLLDCDAIAFALLVKGMDRARRPGVQAIRAIDREARHPVSAGSAAAR